MTRRTTRVRRATGDSDYKQNCPALMQHVVRCVNSICIFSSTASEAKTYAKQRIWCRPLHNMWEGTDSSAQRFNIINFNQWVQTIYVFAYRFGIRSYSAEGLHYYLVQATTTSEADNRSASQEITRISWNTNLYFSIHSSFALCYVLINCFMFFNYSFYVCFIVL